ncbi:MAG: DUF1801 domain-containing protein [Candidatus Dojkabacteria bacterium]|nr:MAG: DUF1801 domain-containing protein [Candidatus Dojkabacteria bacterium]
MAEIKTVKTNASVDAFLDSIENPVRRADGKALKNILDEITKESASMWGPSIVGYGSIILKYPNGRELPFGVIGFSPRKQALTLYLHKGWEEFTDELASLGKYTTGKACLYIKKLSDVDMEALRRLLVKAWSAYKGVEVLVRDNESPTKYS